MNEAGDVVVIVGAGAIGTAIARRQGAGRTVVLADRDEETLDQVEGLLRDEGHDVVGYSVDISVRGAVCDLAREIRWRGRITQLVMAAGLTPTQGSVAEILAVNLQGVGSVLESFGSVISRGGAGVVVSSIAGHLTGELNGDQEQALADVWADELLDLPFTDPARFDDPAAAYAVAKRANHILVQAAAIRWGWQGARVNSISPGMICTPVGKREMGSASASRWRHVVSEAGVGRSGTPDDVAAAASFLLSPEASFITGSDLIIDGGVVAAMRTGQLSLLDA
ncbi:SDR family oxidoreductase [Mycolicibacterium sp. HK-90]|uniref:SDR family oxidoreductase n=1 Tax=Mycolicibacterium sp. HK-90 TaxID=3056937 RepID=UPI00265AA8F3|nr:SDR family oxidoreductase [Mycolicibacterium sp. HK-90]WKG04042.1 SDR family oxidoreductase [Mycolicibacterium sp. HK-90]